MTAAAACGASVLPALARAGGMPAGRFDGVLGPMRASSRTVAARLAAAAAAAMDGGGGEDPLRGEGQDELRDGVPMSDEDRSPCCPPISE